MRLNLFLPFRKRSENRTVVRRILRRIGITWLYSPVRRVLQTACVILFLFLFFYVCWPYGSREYAIAFQAKELLEAEIFLALDPLLSISTALAARMWIWSLPVAGAILLIGVIFPRGFCGYICPFGTLIDLFDWAVGKRVERFKVKRDSWWSHLKYYMLLGTLVASAFQSWLCTTHGIY